jgi:hypothetical protein
MTYVAIVNTPGYLPMDDEPPTFDTAREAWEYLAEERMRADEAWEPDDENDPDGPQSIDDTQAKLEEMARLDRAGTVYAPTPGYDGDHDLGLAYSVEYVHDGFEAGAL